MSRRKRISKRNVQQITIHNHYGHGGPVGGSGSKQAGQGCDGGESPVYHTAWGAVPASPGEWEAAKAEWESRDPTRQTVELVGIGQHEHFHGGQDGVGKHGHDQDRDQGGNLGHAASETTGLGTYDGRSLIIMVLEVEPTADYDPHITRCPSCQREMPVHVVFLAAGGKVFHACPSCYAAFPKKLR